jgi:glutathione peroxidase
MIKTTALLFAALAAASVSLPAAAQATSAPGAPAAARMPMSCPAILKQNFKRLQDDAPQDLCQYAGKVVLVVNTASYCGFTKQYEGLEKLYAKYGGRGLVVLGFPSNDFGKQEPGNAKEIADFCFNTYGVKFPMFAKSSVTGHRSASLPAAPAIVVAQQQGLARHPLPLRHRPRRPHLRGAQHRLRGRYQYRV